MYKVIFEVPTFEQAKMLAKWYDGQGEQDADVWFEENQLRAPMTKNYNIDETNKIVTVRCS